MNRAQLTGVTETVFGWRLHVSGGARPTSLLNFPMQANGAEMLRLAACLVTEAGIDVCAPIHDALLIEAPADGIAEAVATTSRLMTHASAVVLDGWEIGTDVQIVGPGERYSDPRGAVMWERITGLLENAPGSTPSSEWADMWDIGDMREVGVVREVSEVRGYLTRRSAPPHCRASVPRAKPTDGVKQRLPALVQG